jgi:hypothetical protein
VLASFLELRIFPTYLNVGYNSPFADIAPTWLWRAFRGRAKADEAVNIENCVNDINYSL